MAGVLPLSWPQEGVWFFEQSSPGTSAYNIAEAWWLEGPVDIAALQFSLNELVHRHETFRTAIGAKDGKPCQIVFPPKAFPLFHVDIRFREKAASEAERLAASDARIAFDWTQEPLARVILIHFGDEKWLMSVNVHHLISDAWSVGVLMRELAAVYGAHVADRPPNLPDLPVQYGNFTLWQREMAQDGRLRRNLEYWTHQLHGVPPLLLHARRSPPPGCRRTPRRRIVL